MDVAAEILNNVAEAVTPEEVDMLAEAPDGKRAYVGYEPSGVLHAGHMLTATKLIELQSVGFEVIVLLADVHAYLNGKGTMEEIQTTAQQMQSQFLAYGLDSSATEFVLGSSFQLEKEYTMDLHRLAVETSLPRAQRSMAEIAGGSSPTVSQAIYPLMQALDIVYLDIDLAIGGTEQRKVHMLARDMLPRLGYDAPTCLHTPLISDLTTGVGKMSSSVGVTLSMDDSTASIEEKVTAAYCPPTADPPPTDAGDARGHPILELFEYHVFPRVETVQIDRPEEYGGTLTFETYGELESAIDDGSLHPADAKTALASYMDALIAPGRATLSGAE